MRNLRKGIVKEIFIQFIFLHTELRICPSLVLNTSLRGKVVKNKELFSEDIMSSAEGEAEGLDPQEKLEKVHRKEKKELQAKIQALKNSIPKGDKKKKKEVTAEIAKLESDLDQKQSAEMLDLLTDNMSISDEQPTNDDTCDNQNSASTEAREPRVSKAQKRRDKKAEKQKQRLEDIEKQEEENLTGQRHLEQEAIKRLLEARGLTLHIIPSDGDCMFAGEIL